MEDISESVYYEEEIVIENCELDIKTEIEDPLNMESNIPLLTCEKCDFMTTSSVNLKGHKQSHKEMFFMCAKCDFVTNSVLLLNQHLKLHTDDNKCDKCEFTCDLEDDMKVHMDVHHQTPSTASIIRTGNHQATKCEITEEASLNSQQSLKENFTNPEPSHLQFKDFSFEDSPTKTVQLKEEYLTPKKKKIEFLTPEKATKECKPDSYNAPKINSVIENSVSPKVLKVGQKRRSQVNNVVSPNTSPSKHGKLGDSIGSRGRGAAGRGARGGRAIRTRSGLQQDRIFCGMVEQLPEVQPIETPLHNKKPRVLVSRSKPSPESQRLWSSLDMITSDNEAVPSGSGSVMKRTPPLSSASPSPSKLAERGVSQPATPRSSASKRLAFGCGGSVASSPHTLTSRRPSEKHAMPPSSSSQLRDEEICDSLHYGSEEDSEGDEDEPEPMPIPRAARMFIDNEDDEPADAVINQQWPPLPIETATIPGSDVKPVAESIGPINKFDFVWEAFPDPQIPPELRRESFLSHLSGPTTTFNTPYDALVAIWDVEIMNHIATETNIYAQQLATQMLNDGTICPSSRITKWYDTDINELYVYYAIILATGVVVKSRLDEYWNKNQDIFSTPGFTATMKIDRFLLLNRCLHFADNANCNTNDLSRPEAKISKIKPVVDHLNDKFQNLYLPRQNLALDESLTMWKGWLDINQFIPNKAAAIGVKTYELCESSTGYLWRFEIHAGHDVLMTNDPSPISGVIPSIVLKLLQGLEHKGHTIWMDNFYNSPALARELKVRGFDCVGTLRTSRQFVPVEISNLKNNDMVVGQVSGCTSGDVDIVVWRDKNRVALLSTYHGLATVKSGDGRTAKPSIVPDYNVCMGGVDRKDQMIAMFPMERKRNKVWYKKLFRRLLNVSVLNAFIIMKNGSNENLSHRNFRKTLTNQLIVIHAPSRPASGIKLQHFLGQYELLHGNQKKNRMRRRCVVCKTRITSYCKACDVPLCVFTCFETYHSPTVKHT